MGIGAIKELKATLTPGRRVLGLDVGAKTIGMALSDTGLIIATPYNTLRRGRFTDDAATLRRIMEEEDAGAMVIGLPISMDGTEGPRCQSVRQFADNLLQCGDLSLAFWDERLSTAAVQRVLIKEADMTRKRRAQVVDKMAAAYILQGALDAMGYTP